MTTTLLAAIASLLAPATFAQDTQTVMIKTPRGDEVKVIASYPTEVREGEKFPAIVAAPGRNYHQGLVIFEELRRQGVAARMAVFTFDWHFFSSGGKSDPTYVKNVEDMQAVVDYVKADPRVDASRIVLAGKSLGSIVVHKVFAQNPSALALHLWTPLMGSDADMRDLYPGLTEIRKPVLILAGTEDEATNPAFLHGVLAKAPKSIAYTMVPGDHGFELPADHPANATNVAAVMAIAVQWAKVAMEAVGPAPPAQAK